MSRPRLRTAPNDVSSRDSILDAAEVLFATRGFDRATIKEIGTRAHANPALIYYYFGDKTGLYRAVLQRLATALKDQGQPPVLAARTAEAALQGIVLAQARLFAQHPHAARLMFRELIDHDAEHAQVVLHELSAELFRPLVQVVAHGQEVGEIRADLDPRLAAISTIAQLVYFVLAGPAIRILLGKGDGFPAPADLQTFARHAGAFAVSATRARDQLSSAKSRRESLDE